MALALQAAGAGAPIETLTPSGKWNVQFEQELCAMSRRFGVGPVARTLIFRPRPLNDSLEVIVIAPASAGRQRSGAAETVLDPGGPRLTGTYEAFALADRSRINHVNIYTLSPALLATAEMLTIVADDETQRFAIGKPAGALRVLGQCEAQLLASWGVDPAHINVAHRPAIMGNAGSLFGPEAFPRAALTAHVEGRSTALLSIDRAGKVSDCHIVQKAPHPSLDEATCKQARKISFTPARDATGTPVAGSFMLPVRWYLPRLTDR